MATKEYPKAQDPQPHAASSFWEQIVAVAKEVDSWPWYKKGTPAPVEPEPELCGSGWGLAVETIIIMIVVTMSNPRRVVSSILPNGVSPKEWLDKNGFEFDKATVKMPTGYRMKLEQDVATNEWYLIL